MEAIRSPFIVCSCFAAVSLTTHEQSSHVSRRGRRVFLKLGSAWRILDADTGDKQHAMLLRLRQKIELATFSHI